MPDQLGKREAHDASILQGQVHLPAPLTRLVTSIFAYFEASTMIGDAPDHFRRWIGEQLQSLGWLDNDGTSMSDEQYKEKVVGKLAQKGLEELRSKHLRVQSSDVVVTILQINKSNPSFVEVALELLAYASQPPGGSTTREEKLQRLETQYFSPELCTSEISVHELYRNILSTGESQAQFSTYWYVLSGEQSSIMSCVKMLRKQSSSRGGWVESDLAQLLNTATLKLQAADDSTNHLLTFWVRPLPRPHKRTLRHIIARYWASILGCTFPMAPGIQAGSRPAGGSAQGTTFPGQPIFNGSRLAAYYLNQGNLFKLIAAVKVSVTPDLPLHDGQLELKAREAPFGPAKDHCTELRVSVQLNLHDPHQGCTIVNAGALYRASPSDDRERMEFFFSSPTDMAACVGVGFPRSKVVLSKDLSVTVQESEGDEWESSAPYLEQPGPPAVPSDEDSGQQVLHTAGAQATDVITQTFRQPESGNDQQGSSKYANIGVGSDEIVHLNFETARISQDLSWPLLHEIAWAILTQKRAAGQCCLGRPEEPESSHASRTQSNSMLQNLDSKRLQECAAVQKQNGQGGDGEETSSPTVDSRTDLAVREDDALPDVEMKVKVVLLPKRVVDIKFLDDASIAPQLEFMFCRKQGERRISIRTVIMLSLRTADEVTKGKDYFGWYQDDVSISLACARCHSNEYAGRAAYLEEGSAQISNTVATSTKHSTGRTSTESTADGRNYGGSGRAGVSGFGIAATLEGGKRWWKKKEASSSETENSEVTPETVCNGFLVQDRGNDMCAEFSLWHPEVAGGVGKALWDRKAWLLDRGLFSTIRPAVEGTWIAVDKHDASPYALCIKRDLKLHHRHNGLVQELAQNHRISFCINHSLSHLDHYVGKPMKKLLEDLPQPMEIPNVIKVSRSSQGNGHAGISYPLQVTGSTGPQTGPVRFVSSSFPTEPRVTM